MCRLPTPEFITPPPLLQALTLRKAIVPEVRDSRATPYSAEPEGVIQIIQS